jgi:hypothetical protein
MARPIVVHADWDPEASVRVATIEALRTKLPGMILDLLEEHETT